MEGGKKREGEGASFGVLHSEVVGRTENGGGNGEQEDIFCCITSYSTRE